MLIIFMVFGCFCLGFTSCKCFEYQARVTRIGSGYIHPYNNAYCVEINSIKYFPEEIYIESSRSDERYLVNPVDGMKVTVFCLHGNNKLKFIAGEYTEETLEKYFTIGTTNIVVFLVIVLVCVVILVANINRSKK